jgi:hypothetical protein
VESLVPAIKPSKVAVVIKIEPWILAALNVVRQKSHYKTYRTNIIEKMLTQGLKVQGLTAENKAVREEFEKVLAHESKRLKRKAERKKNVPVN